MKLSEVISKLEAHKAAHGDVQLQFAEDLAVLLGIAGSKCPGMYCITTIIEPTQNLDGSWSLAGRDGIAKRIAASVSDALKGQEGNILTLTGWNGFPDSKPVPAPIPLPKPEVLPPLGPPWWELLTGNKDKIYAAKDNVQIYITPSPSVEPTTMNIAMNEKKQAWKLPKNSQVEVWQKPKQGTGWICVHINSSRALWVRGEDMAGRPV